MEIADTAAVAALVVALVAFVVAVGQLLGQYFVTADGYRKCRASIIGPWSNTRRRHYVWSEFRFETTFMTPRFFFHDNQPANPEESIVRKPLREGEAAFITGSSASCIRTMAPNIGSWSQNDQHSTYQRIQRQRAPGKQPDEESLISLRDLGPNSSETLSNVQAELRKADFAGWLQLLENLQKSEAEYREFSYQVGTPSSATKSQSPSRRWPAIQAWPRSWDLIPPDAARPLASATLRDIIILGVRLGISWMIAESPDRVTLQFRGNGDGHYFETVEVRGLGTVLNYFYQNHADLMLMKLRNSGQKVIPSADADRLAFGIIPVCRDLFDLDESDLDFGGYEIGSHYDEWDSFPKMLETLGVSTSTLERLNDDFVQGGLAESSSKTDLEDYIQNWQTANVVADVVSIVAPFMPIPNLYARRITAPYYHNIDSPLRTAALAGKLFPYLRDNASTRIPSLQQKVDEWRQLMDNYYKDQNSRQAGKTDQGLQAQVQEMQRNLFHWTTKYFQSLSNSKILQKTGPNGQKMPFEYKDLVAAHVEMAVAVYETDAKLGANQASNAPGTSTAGAAVKTHAYNRKARNDYLAHISALYLKAIHTPLNNANHPLLIQSLISKGYDDLSLPAPSPPSCSPSSSSTTSTTTIGGPSNSSNSPNRTNPTSASQQQQQQQQQRTRDIAIDAWYIMALRAFTWWTSVEMKGSVEGTIPSEYWNSGLNVWLM